MANGLPEGFVVDEAPQPVAPVEIPQDQQGGALPQGFQMDTPDTPWLDVLREGFSNIPSSGLKFGSDVAQSIAHPLDTITGLGQLVFGAIDAALPDPTTAPEDPDGPGQSRGDLIASRDQREALIDATVTHLQSRYSSVEKFKGAVSSDPVGVAADLATLLTGGGTALKAAGRGAQLSRLAQVGSAVQKVGAAVEPLQVAKQLLLVPPRIVGKVIPPTELFLSATKISKTIDPAKRRELAQLALDQRIVPTAEGLEKLRGQINTLGSEVGGLLDDAAASGVSVPGGQLLKGFKELRQKLKNSEFLPQNALDMLDEIGTQMSRDGVQVRTPQQVQALKQSLQNRLANFYGAMNDAPASRQAQNAIAVAAKETLERLVPGIGELNKELGPRLQLEEVLTGAANRIQNHDLVSLRTGVTGTAGAAAGGLPGLAAGASLGLLDKPGVKTHLAMLLNEAQRRGKVNVAQALISLGVSTPERLTNEGANLEN